MGIGGALFYGYREEDVDLAFPVRGLPPFALLSPPQTDIVEIEMLSTPTYQYEVWRGEVPDEYPAEMYEVGFESRMLVISVLGRAIIQFSFDATDLLQEKQLRGDHRIIQAIRGFRIRKAVLGQDTSYQVVAMR